MKDRTEAIDDLDVTSAAFFERKYRESEDPWNFATSEYEQARYKAIMDALGDREYARAFEPGCSVGELTLRLAQRCGHLDAMDISATAVARANDRCRGYSNVGIHVGALPHQIPDDGLDLIVFSEIGYYFEERALQELADILVRRLRTTGVLVAVHWLGTSNDHLLSGDRVHEILRATSGLRLQQEERHTGFRLDRWIRV